MHNPLNLLVPVDFKEESEIALEYALIISKRIKVKIHLIYIIEEESPLVLKVLTNEQLDMIRRGASDRLDELAGKKLGHSGVSFTTSVKEGKIYKEIVEAARTLEADLIIMGRTGSSDMVKNFTGTNTMHILWDAEVPVITLRKKPEYFGCKHILLPLDLTKQTIIQASHAISIAHLLDAHVTLSTLLSEDSVGQEIQFVSRLDQIRNIFEGLNITCDIKLVKGRSGEAISIMNATAKEVEADLIMIMTQQELNFTDYFIGSMAQRIINQSELPVLSINTHIHEVHEIPDPMLKIFLDPIRSY